MTRTMYWLTLVVLFAALPVFNGHSAEPKKANEIMMKKLKQSQIVLEGLAMKDFKKISRSADELLFLTKEEEWKVLSTPDYENYSNEFRRHVQGLIKNSREENLDACALNYVELSLTCVKCHKYVREVRMGQLPQLREDRLLDEQ